MKIYVTLDCTKGQ